MANRAVILRRRTLPLFHARERLDLEFEGLGVLALNLHFRLEFFDEEIEPCDFRAELLYVRGGRRGT